MMTTFFKILLACVIMCLFLEIFAKIYLFLLIALASAVYFILVCLLRILDNEDMYILKQLLIHVHVYKGERDV